MDYRYFVEDDVPGQIKKMLAKDQKFAAIVADIRQMSNAERSRLLYRAQRTYKATWKQIGCISRRGQTLAGQKAERLCAEAIVGLVKQNL